MWGGEDGKLACFAAGNWLFVAPGDGLRVLNRSTGQDLRYLDGWLAVDTPSGASGGTTVDTEARAAIAGLIDALRGAGIFAAS